MNTRSSLRGKEVLGRTYKTSYRIKSSLSSIPHLPHTPIIIFSSYPRKAQKKQLLVKREKKTKIREETAP